MVIFYLLGKRCGWRNLEGFEEVMVDRQAWLIHKHASIEIKGRPGAQLRVPLDLIRALLAVPYLILWATAPSWLTEAVLHSIEVVVRGVKEVIDVLKNLNISVQIDHLAVLHKLQNLH